MSGPFLATTALEEFWDPSRPMLFLGEGCRRFSRRSSWEGLDAAVLPPGDAAAGRAEVEAAYEALLPAFADAARPLRSRAHGPRWARIVYGPWLQWYAGAVHDRWRALRAALDLHPGLTTIGLDESCHATALDTLDFQVRLSDDAWNLQLHTRLLAAMGLDFPRRKASFPAPARPAAAGGWKGALRAAWRAAWRAGQEGRPLIARGAYFPRAAELSLVLRTGGTVWPSAAPEWAAAPGPLDPRRREALKGLPCGAGEFGRLLSALLPADVPRAFVEGWADVEAAAERGYPRRPPRAIFSANEWYFNEPFKHWAGACAEAGTRLLGTQHGGYGVRAHGPLPSEEHELAIVDRFYTWGWTRAGTRAETVPMPATKMTGRGTLGADGSRDGVLFALTTVPRHAEYLPLTPDQFAGVLRRQREFAAALAPELRRVMRVRPHRVDFGWETAERWREAHPEVGVESWSVPFEGSLADCRVFVCDHISTTYLEALAADKPTVLFWDPRAAMNELHPDARPYFDALREAGVLHDSPAAAAAALEAAYADVEGWWAEPRRRAAVAAVRERFARTSPDALGLWAAELSRASAA